MGSGSGMTLLVYLGMILGGLPFLKLDRTGVALLGAIALVATGAATEEDARAAIHVPTLTLLFSFMVVSAQLRMGGFYDWAARRLGALPLALPVLLGALNAVTAGLAAVFSNDIVCLAMAPVLARHLYGPADRPGALPARPLAAGPDGPGGRRNPDDQPTDALPADRSMPRSQGIVT